VRVAPRLERPVAVRRRQTSQGPRFAEARPRRRKMKSATPVGWDRWRASNPGAARNVRGARPATSRFDGHVEGQRGNSCGSSGRRTWWRRDPGRWPTPRSPATLSQHRPPSWADRARRPKPVLRFGRASILSMLARCSRATSRTSRRCDGRQVFARLCAGQDAHCGWRGVEDRAGGDTPRFRGVAGPRGSGGHHRAARGALPVHGSPGAASVISVGGMRTRSARARTRRTPPGVSIFGSNGPHRDARQADGSRRARRGGTSSIAQFTPVKTGIARRTHLVREGRVQFWRCAVRCSVGVKRGGWPSGSRGVGCWSHLLAGHQGSADAKTCARRGTRAMGNRAQPSCIACRRQ